MKKIILCFLILLTTKSLVAQKIILHTNAGGDQTFQLSSVDSISFQPFVCGDEVRYEGKTYHTVLIGNQCWLKENLDVGTMIPVGTDQSSNSIIEKYCFNNSQDSCAKYGGLYMWNETMQYSTVEGVRGICPEGWHIPTLSDFNTFYTAVGGDGNAIKAIGQGSGGGAGTNTSGFSALLGGIREYNRTFTEFNNHTHFWSSTGGGGQANQIYLWPTDNRILFHFGNITVLGFSVRCIKNN